MVNRAERDEEGRGYVCDSNFRGTYVFLQEVSSQTKFLLPI